jgi:hypothetical protein
MIRDDKLRDAAKALERAADAAWQSVQYPNGRALPCRAQQDAATAEVECAKRLIEEAQSDD